MQVGISRRVFGLIVLVAVVVSFAVGYAARGAGRIDVQIYTGSGYVGADQATFFVGDTSFGLQSSVPWRDQSGSEHDSGWPACLPKFQTFSGVRFGGAVVWHGTTGEARVLWVDCQT